MIAGSTPAVAQETMRAIGLTPRFSIFGDIEYDTNTQWEYLGGAAYALSKRLSLTAIYDSDHGFGAGVLFRF